MWKNFLTIKEASELVGVTPLTLRNWDKKGKLTAHRHPMNNYRLYSLKEMEKIAKQIRGSRPRKLKVQKSE